MRPVLLLALLLLPALAAPAAGQVGNGERVDLTAAEFPAVAVAGRPFFVNVTLTNRGDAEEHVVVNALLYDRGGQGPCDGRVANQDLSAFVKSVRLGPRATVRVEGERDFWRHVVNGSRVADGTYEVCVLVRLASVGGCAQGADLAPCFLDRHPLQLAVRMRNAPPQVQAVAEPAAGTTATTFTLRAQGSDPDGDRLTYRWEFANGEVRSGDRANYRFRSPGTWSVVLNGTDGWDHATTTLRVSVAQGPQGGGSIPGLEAAGVVAALILTAAAGRARRRG